MLQVQPIDVLPEWRKSAPYWAKHNATIREMFAPLTRALIEDAVIVPGQSVLDIAGGPGEPSLTISEAVGPAGCVTCTDAVAEMVEAARTEARNRRLSNVQFRQCTADELPFPDNSFDVTVSRLGAMFFPEPELAFRGNASSYETGRQSWFCCVAQERIQSILTRRNRGAISSH